MPTLKSAPVDHKQAETLANDVLRLFASYGNPAKAPSASELEKYFTSNLAITSNERNVCNSLNDFVTRIRNIQKNYSSMVYSKLLDTPIVDGNRVAIRYNIDLKTPSGQASQFQILAFLTVEDGKVSRWTDIIHKKGSGSFDNFNS